MSRLEDNDFEMHLCIARLLNERGVREWHCKCAKCMGSRPKRGRPFSIDEFKEIVDWANNQSEETKSTGT